LSIVLDSVLDYSGNSLKDSALIRKFKTIDRRKLSEVRGIVISAPIDTLNEVAVVEIKKINAIVKSSKKLTFKKQADFVFEDLEEGQYVIAAFLSKNGNGLYDYGKVFPYRPAEKFIFYPDTVKVRARWPVEGIILKFEK
jgi:predicted amidohydrolase